MKTRMKLKTVRRVRRMIIEVCLNVRTFPVLHLCHVLRRHNSVFMFGFLHVRVS